MRTTWAIGPALLLLLWCGSGQARDKAPPSLAAAKRSQARKRPQPPAARCRDIFCTAEVVRMDSTDGGRRLTAQDVERVMSASQGQLEPCLVEARRRDPKLVGARIELVVDQQGRVLASRTNGQRQTPLARCIDRKLRLVRFPRVEPKRTVAEFTLGIPQ